MAFPWRARSGGSAAFAAFISFDAFMAFLWRARSGGAAAFAAFITFIAMARDQLVFPQRRHQADDFMSLNGYGCVLTLPLLLLPLLLLLLLLLLQYDDGWSRLFRFSPDTVRRRLWPKWATSAAQGLRPKKAVSISISLRVVARTSLRRHARK